MTNVDEKDEIIEFYDEDGQKVYIKREEFCEKVLPYNIHMSWNDPQALYNVILSNVDEFSLELENAGKRQIEIDDIPERSHCIASIVLIRNNKLIDARQVLESYIKKYGPTAAILTNLAKTYLDNLKCEEILWSAIQLDPNYENSLEFWLVIRRDRNGEEAYLPDLLMLSQIPNTWVPQLYLIGEYLRGKNLKIALPLIKHVLETAPRESNALFVISGDLGSNGFEQGIIDIILPLYSHTCGEALRVLHNILEAFYSMRKAHEGLTFINKLKPTLQSKDDLAKMEQIYLAEFLNGYEEKFKKIATK